MDACVEYLCSFGISEERAKLLMPKMGLETVKDCKYLSHEACVVAKTEGDEEKKFKRAYVDQGGLLAEWDEPLISSKEAFKLFLDHVKAQLKGKKRKFDVKAEVKSVATKIEKTFESAASKVSEKDKAALKVQSEQAKDAVQEKAAGYLKMADKIVSSPEVNIIGKIAGD